MNELIPEGASRRGYGERKPGMAVLHDVKFVRVDHGAELAVVAIARDGRRRLVLADPAVAPLRLGGRAVPARDRLGLDALGPIAVRWSIVEPHGFRTGAAANGATSRFYSNVSTERGDFGRWLGYDRIEYFATEVRPWTDGVTGARPRSTSGCRRRGWRTTTPRPHPRRCRRGPRPRRCSRAAITWAWPPGYRI